MATFVVTTANVEDDDLTVTGDLAAETADGDGLSLVEALALADAAPDHDQITFAAALSGEVFGYDADDPLFRVASPVAIDGDLDGDGRGDIGLTGDMDFGAIFTALPGADVLMTGVSIFGGDGGGYNYGAYVYGEPYGHFEGGGLHVAEGAAVTMVNGALSHNTSFNEDGALDGAGAWVAGSLTLVNSFMSGNHVECGDVTALEVRETGRAHFINSVVSDNLNVCGGFTIRSDGDLILENSAVINNNGVFGHTAIVAARATIINSVIGDNDAFGLGGSADVSVGALTAQNSFFSTPARIDTDLGGNVTGGGPSGLAADLTLHVGSALRDAGDAGLLAPDIHDLDRDGDVAEPTPVDLLGAPRAAFGAIDIGPVEAQTRAPEIAGGDADETLTGGADAERILGGAGEDRIFAGGGDDGVFGGAQNDLILAQGGDDYVYGGSGSDFLHGQRGDDILFGGKGYDRLLGGLGDDTMFGGLGRDVFVMKEGWGYDRIGDFTRGEDRLKVSGFTFEDMSVYTNANSSQITFSPSLRFRLDGPYIGDQLTAADFIFA